MYVLMYICIKVIICAYAYLFVCLEVADIQSSVPAVLIISYEFFPIFYIFFQNSEA